MFSLNCKGKLLLIEKPLVMGILNITEDSFYAESRVQSIEAIKNKATQMVKEGADILDIGAQSTRPGSKRISAKDELEKVIPAIEMLANLFPGIIISIDTYHAEVASKSVKAGAGIVNDISAGEMDMNMLSVVASLNVPYICMHMKGEPATMQQNPGYEDVTKEVLDFFIKKTAACKLAGINDVIIDPGFGFGKNILQNLSLLKNLSVFRILEKPILAGISRKSTIYKTLKIPVEDSINGTTVLNTLALHNRASILRVHDVKEAKEIITLMKEYTKA
ncbi:MAG: dihydropteroate synthase [Bacteroidota bacterium]|nr:dihydropteroate synthase [Bacteroidota bacterium]